MAEVSERSSLLAEMVKRKMVHFATPNAELVSTELDQSVGSIALMASEMMELSATSPHLTEEELVIPFGTKTSARETTQISDVRSGAQYGTPNAELTSTTLDAVFAHPTAHLDRLTSAFHAPRIPTAVEQASHLFAKLASK
jgi:hypothetical protein